METIDTLDTQPFKNLVMSIGALPTSFVDSMSYYEALAWLVNYLQTQVIPAVNNNAEALSELQTAFITLKDYVDHYFDNLDVQEEINNKLDEMVEDGTLQAIIDAYLDSLTETVQYIFPKNWDAYSGDTALIKGYDKTIMIDTFRATNKSDLYSMLSDNSVSHIDYLILTHYHDDHIGNVINLITDGYVDDASYVYIPPDCQQIVDSPELTAIKNAIIAKLQEYGIPYSIPAENSKLSIDTNFDVEFYNTDATALSDYTNYNNCSTLCKVRHLNKISLFTSDDLGQAIYRATNNGFINGHVDLYKAEHHGIEYNNAIFRTLKLILPTFVYQPSFVRDAEIGNYANGTTIAYLQTKGSKIYASVNNPDYIKFQSFNNTFDIMQGVQSTSVSNNNYVGNYIDNFHVDASTTNAIQNGTAEYPFKELSQAIGAAEKLNSGCVRIFLADGEYGVSHPTDENKNNILANGVNLYITKESDATAADVIIKSNVKFENSKIKFESVSFTNKASVTNNLRFNNCTVEIRTCNFDGTANVNTVGIYAVYSELLCVSNNVANIKTFIDGYYSHHMLVNNTFNTVNLIETNRSGVSDVYGSTKTSVTNISNLSNGAIRTTLVELYDGNTSPNGGTINLKDDISKYNKLTIVSGMQSNGTLCNDIVTGYLPDNFAKNNTYHYRTLSGTVAFTVSASGTSLTLATDDATENIRKVFAEKVFKD